MKMRKFLLVLAAVFSYLAAIKASNNIVVSDVVIPKGGAESVSVALNNDKAYTAFSMKLTLPDGISYVSVVKGGRMSESHSLSGNGSNGMITCLSTSNDVFTGTSGELFTINITADDALEVGTTIQATLTEVNFSTTSAEETLESVTFNITIDEPDDGRVLLDETSTTAPEASGEPVDVRVRRAIKANEWSTICLPFAMTEAQTKAAFGDDVQLAMFSDWSSEEDEDDDEIIVGIEISFSSVDVADGIEANTPLLIKVTNKVDEFTVDGVTIDPEEEPSVMIKHGTKKRDPESYMIGTYQAETVLDNLTLFLNGNKFWYSTGKTKMKAYRAYFNIYDILTEVEDAYAAVKMAIDVDGTTTHVEGINMNDGEGAVYDMSGRRVSKPSQRGIYIVNGQKVLVK